jgi:hypothetical protein
MVHPDVQLLRKRADELLSRLFQRKPLVRAKWSDDAAGFKQQFDQAGTLYRVGAFGEARQIFLDVAAASPDKNSGLGLIATFNAAACAAAADDYRGVIELLEPHGGIVKGHPLWNLALSHYKLGEMSQAVTALRAWTLRALPDEKGRGALVAACVACKSGDFDTTGHLLTEAKIANENFVLDELGVSKKQQPNLVEAAELQPRHSLSEVKRNRVLQLLPPKKPERRPELAVTLSASEVESFSTAVEAIAERKSPPALQILRGLEKKYPEQHHLHIALAAAELFAGNAVAA